MSAREVSVAQSRAREGNISASVALECHYLANGDKDGALTWLRQSALREPLTGTRYVRYLLSAGDKASCRIADSLIKIYATHEWLPDEIRRELSMQETAARGCS